MLALFYLLISFFNFKVKGYNFRIILCKSVLGLLGITMYYHQAIVLYPLYHNIEKHPTLVSKRNRRQKLLDLGLHEK